jgi:hypothetical protein
LLATYLYAKGVLRGEDLGADFLCEIKQPLKRRIGLRYSNEFYFVTPAGLLKTSELPIECGLVEVGAFGQDERSIVHAQSGTLVHFEANHGMYCRVTVLASLAFILNRLLNQITMRLGTRGLATDEIRLCLGLEKFTRIGICDRSLIAEVLRCSNDNSNSPFQSPIPNTY